jgi:hypothetical protein
MILRHYRSISPTPDGPYGVWEVGGDFPVTFAHETVYDAIKAAQTHGALVVVKGHSPIIGEVTLTEHEPVDDGCTCNGIPGTCKVDGHGPMPERLKNDPVKGHLRYLRLTDAELDAIAAAGITNAALEFERGERARMRAERGEATVTAPMRRVEQ